VAVDGSNIQPSNREADILLVSYRWASASCSKILNDKKIFITVNSLSIHLRVIRVIWASVVSNLDQSRDWL